MLNEALRAQMIIHKLDLRSHFDKHAIVVKELYTGIEKTSDYKFDLTSVYAWHAFCSKHGILHAACTNPIPYIEHNRKNSLKLGGMLRRILEEFHGFVRIEAGIPQNSLDDIAKHKRFPGLNRSIRGKMEQFKQTIDIMQLHYVSTNPNMYVCIQDTDYGRYDEVQIQNWKIKHAASVSAEVFAQNMLDKLKEYQITPTHPQCSEIAEGSFFMRFETSDNLDTRFVDAGLHFSSDEINNALKGLKDE